MSLPTSASPSFEPATRLRGVGQRSGIERRVDAVFGDAHQNRHAARRQEPERLLDRRFDAGGHEHIVGAATTRSARGLLSPADRPFRPRGRRSRRRSLAASCRLAARSIAMMRLGSSDARRLNAVQANAACADDHDVAVRAHIGAIGDRAKAGDHAAGENGRHLEGQIGIDLDDLRAMHRGPLGESGGLSGPEKWTCRPDPSVWRRPP